MLRAILLFCAAATVLACGTTEPDPGLPVLVEKLGFAIPPDSLIGMPVEEWWAYPPIVEIEGGEGEVVIRGDYTLRTYTADLVAYADYEAGTLMILVEDRFDGDQLLGHPKLAYRVTVSKVPPGTTPVLVRYNVWDPWRFGDIGRGETDVLEGTAVVR